MALDFARDAETQKLESMLKHGLSPNLCTHKDDSLLMLATYNGNLETSKMLLNFGADINKVNQRGQTPLEGVCFKGNLEMVKLLIKNGAKSDGNAIVYATIFGNMEIVNYLQQSSSKKKILGINIKLIVKITSKIKKLFS